MKRDKSFYYVFIMFLFVTCYITCYILSNRTIEFGGMIATASAMIYPFTYFIAVLFYERYGKNRVFELINFSIVALIFMGIMFAFAGTFNVHGGSDGLEKLFNIDFRVLFSSIVAFIVGQYVNIKLYDFLGNKKGFDFLIAGVIAITIDSFLFVGLSQLGTIKLTEVLNLATGQYALSVIAIIIYALCFNSLMPTLLETKDKNEEITSEEKPKRKTSTTKKSSAKTTTSKKSDSKTKTEQQKTTSN
ncbi:MAG: VUT family protein [Bacilli bacterium]